MPLDDVKAALQRRAAARAGTTPASSFSGGGATGDLPGAPPAAPTMSPEPLRARRVEWMVGAQGQASKDYLDSLGAFVDLRRQDPENPNLPALQGDLTSSIGRLMPPVTEGQAAALSREAARRGGSSPALDAAPDRIRAAIERGARVIDPKTGLAGKLNRFNAGVSSAFQYPLKLVSALLRPLDAGAPAAAAAAIEGRPVLPAAAAGADPLGRFSPGGAETGRWTNPAPSWHDVTSAALQRWGTEKTTGVVGMSSDPSRVGMPVKEKSLLGMGPSGWAGVGTVADIGLSPSTYLTAPAGAGKGIQLAGRTVVPDAVVSAVARAPGSVLERGAEALAARLALDPRVPMAVTHRVGAAGEALGKVGAAQVVSAAPRVAGALPLGAGKTLGELLGETFDRYHRISQVHDPALRAELLRLAQFRESGTQGQTSRWTDQVERLFQGVSPEDQRLVRDLIENPGGYDWGVQARDPLHGTTDALARRVGVERHQPGAGAIGPETGVPRPPSEVRVEGTATTSGPSVLPGQPAAPTAVPGTPDAKRYGPIPEHLSGQVPTVTPLQAELAGRTENILRDVRTALERRALIRGRENYFPRERTRESLVLQRGEEARAEKLGRGVAPRLDWRAGFQEGRKEAGWINDLIDRVNDQAAREAAAKGMTPDVIPHVQDTTAALNAFWQRLPERIRVQLGRAGKGAEPERFLDDPKATLERYLSRATKSVNDFDTMRQVARLDGEGGKVARPFLREDAAGRVWEPYDVPARGAGEGGPGVISTPAPAGAPRLEVGAPPGSGGPLVAPPRRPAPQLPGETAAPGAFEGVSSIDPAMPRGERPIHGYTYPKNPAWRQAFPNQALPKDVAAWIDAFGQPYWAQEGLAGLIDQGIVRPLHKVQLPWKVAATSGAGPRFALRNYMSQQVMNLQAYGPTVLMPRIQRESHLLGLPDAIIAERPHLADRVFTDATGRQWKAAELRAAAQQTGLWRTMPEAETWSAIGGPFSDIWSGPAHAGRVAGWSTPKAQASAVLGAMERGVQRATRAVGPVNPISKDFAPTKHVFHPLAEYGERQGRMAALLAELDQGKELVQAAQDAARTHVNYAAFSPAFEKYGTLAYPFAKFAVGITPNEAKWALQYPGRTMFTEHLLRGGEAMVPPEERARYEREPKSSLIQQGGGRLVGWPGAGTLKEPETSTAKGSGRLPYVTLPPTADVFLNTFGMPARIAAAPDHGKALASEAFESSLPVFKGPYEWATGRNVFTGEPVDMGMATMAPRAVQALYDAGGSGQWIARNVLKASPVVDRKTGQQYLAVPQRVALIWRYFPNVAAADLAAGLLGVKRPYDNETAMALRLLGVTQVMHDPLVPATQEAFAAKDEAAKTKRRLESYTPPRGR